MFSTAPDKASLTLADFERLVRTPPRSSSPPAVRASYSCDVLLFARSTRRCGKEASSPNHAAHQLPTLALPSTYTMTFTTFTTAILHPAREIGTEGRPSSRLGSARDGWVGG